MTYNNFIQTISVKRKHWLHFKVFTKYYCVVLHKSTDKHV